MTRVMNMKKLLLFFMLCIPGNTLPWKEDSQEHSFKNSTLTSQQAHVPESLGNAFQLFVNLENSPTVEISPALEAMIQNTRALLGDILSQFRTSTETSVNPVRTPELFIHTLNRAHQYAQEIVRIPTISQPCRFRLSCLLNLIARTFENPIQAVVLEDYDIFRRTPEDAQEVLSSPSNPSTPFELGSLTISHRQFVRTPIYSTASSSPYLSSSTSPAPRSDGEELSSRSATPLPVSIELSEEDSSSDED